MTDDVDGIAEAQTKSALDALAREVATASPRPTPDLVARVLADAAAVSASRAALAGAGVATASVGGGAVDGTPAPRATAGATDGGAAGLLDWLLGWSSGATAALALSLALGITIGYGLEPGDLPMTAQDLSETVAMADGGLFQDDVL